MPRLFVAIPVPESRVRDLAGLKTERLNARWLDAAGHHLTLKFIGDVDGEKVQTIAAGLGQVARGTFTIQMHGLQVFPGFRAPRVLVVTVARDPELLRLQTDVERALEQLDIPRETRPYHPHITIARFRSETAQNVRGYLMEHREFSLEPFEADYFSLYSSRTLPDGAVYERLSTYNLN